MCVCECECVCVCKVVALTGKKKRKEKNRKDSAGSDDTASMIKGGGYIGARTRQPPTAQTNKKKLMWVRGVVCRSHPDPNLNSCCLGYIAVHTLFL